MAFTLKVWGPYACFTRPEFKVERVSYDVMTPSAARGILSSIYWHHGVQYVIDQIYVCNPIKFANFKRNELKSVLNVSTLKSCAVSGRELPYVITSSDRTQRASRVLKDVCYIIQFHFELSSDAVVSKDKVAAILSKRIRGGKFFKRPCFGCREFPAFFEECSYIPSCPDELKGTHDLGWMLGDMDWRDEKNPVPSFFRAVMTDGCIEVPAEVRVW